MQRWQRSSNRGKRFHHVTAKLTLAVCHDPHRCGPSVMQVAPIKITSRTIGCDASFDVDKLPWKQVARVRYEHLFKPLLKSRRWSNSG